MCLLALALATSPAMAADSWFAGADTQWPGRNDLLLENNVAGSQAWGLVPPFRAGARDRTSVGIGAGATFSGRVRVTSTADWLCDHTDAGGSSCGWGDSRLGTVVRALPLGPVDVLLGWEAKMPNARDEGELGTDETDVLFGGALLYTHGPYRAGVGGGLGIRGNPLRFANQDDVPMLRVDAAYVATWWRVRPFLVVDFNTSRNPTRAEAGVGARFGTRFFADVEGAAGLTPAEADARVLLRLGFAMALPEHPSGE